MAPTTPARETALVKTFDVHKYHSAPTGCKSFCVKKGYRMGHQRLCMVLARRGLRALQPKDFAPRTINSPHGLRYVPNRLLDQPKPT